jgi:thioester reductase-like protein
MKKLLLKFAFNRHIELPESITPENARVEWPAEAENILLTGATGFLGRFLLVSLLKNTKAKIYCLVRLKKDTAAQQRLNSLLAAYGFEEYIGNQRIIAVEGDLEKDRLGISENRYDELCHRVDTIFHSGAVVNYAFPYEALKKANVDGAEEVLRMAVTSRLKRVHHISSLFVFSAKAYKEEPVIYEDFVPEHCAGIRIAYGQSKWVAERKMITASKRGIPTTIYRIGRLCGDTQSGICQTNDLVWTIVKCCIALKSAPQLNYIINLAPVDYVSNAIVEISRHESAQGKCFHVINPKPMQLNELIDLINAVDHKIDIIDNDEWLRNIKRLAKQTSDGATNALARIFSRVKPEDINRVYDMTHANEVLTKVNLLCPNVDRSLVELYLNYFDKIGYIRRESAAIP